MVHVLRGIPTCSGIWFLFLFLFLKCTLSPSNKSIVQAARKRKLQTGVQIKKGDWREMGHLKCRKHYGTIATLDGWVFASSNHKLKHICVRITNGNLCDECGAASPDFSISFQQISRGSGSFLPFHWSYLLGKLMYSLSFFFFFLLGAKERMKKEED